MFQYIYTYICFHLYIIFKNIYIYDLQFHLYKMFVSSGRHINKDLPWIYPICLISVRFSTRLFPQVTARKIWKVQRKPPGPRSGSVEKWPGKRIDRLSHDESYEGLKNTHPWLYGWDFWKINKNTFACFSVLSLTRIICNLCIYIHIYVC